MQCALPPSPQASRHPGYILHATFFFFLKIYFQSFIFPLKWTFSLHKYYTGDNFVIKKYKQQRPLDQFFTEAATVLLRGVSFLPDLSLYMPKVDH